MTLETFFEKFDQFAAAPNAVAKMRGLFLRQAMQGSSVTLGLIAGIRHQLQTAQSDLRTQRRSWLDAESAFDGIRQDDPAFRVQGECGKSWK